MNDKLMLIIGKIEDLIVEIDGVEQSDIDFSLSEINRFNFGKLKFDLSFVSQSKVSHKALSYLVGCAFARWDFNYNAKQDINAIYTALDNPIPISSPAQLINSSVMDESHGQFNEIMPIDGDHSNDLCKKIYVLIGRLEQTGRLSESFAELQNLPQCELSSYFEKPNKFFSDHLRQYTKSRRQAPIYWPIQTSSCTYTFWLYYHALNEQTLFSCVNNFVDLKLEAVVDDISSLRSKPSRSSNDERVLASLIDLEAELKDFRDELLHIAQFWKPNLNDGVQITAAPLWKLFQHKTWQKKLKRTWEELEQGKYDWSHMAYNIWPERVLKICHQDRSIAIAHDVEADLWEEVEVPAARGKGTKWVWHPKEMTEAELDAYIQLKIAKG